MHRQFLQQALKLIEKSRENVNRRDKNEILRVLG